MMIIDYGYCNYVKKLQYSEYIVHQLKDIVTLRPQCRKVSIRELSYTYPTIH